MLVCLAASHPDCPAGTWWHWYAHECVGDCLTVRIGDGVCDPECYLEEFIYDSGDCGHCPSAWVGDGNCDFACDIDKYMMDGGDCAEWNQF